MRRGRTGVCAGLLLLLGATAAQASIWAGTNGVVRLSLAMAASPEVASADSLAWGYPDSIVSVLETAADQQPVMVDLYAVLDHVDPVQYKGERFLAIGGFEMALVVEGAEPVFVDEALPPSSLNIGPEKRVYYVGIPAGLDLHEGRALLAHWRLMFMQRPRNVAFHLDPGELFSCPTAPGCEQSGARSLYVGALAADQHNIIVGAAGAPAYLNWEGEPDTQPRGESHTWRKGAILEAAEESGPLLR
jgi:hypothetical protein